MNSRTDFDYSQPELQPATWAGQSARGVRAHARRIAGLFKQWRHNSITRRQLAELPDYLQKDAGLSAQQIQHELAKPFWKS